MSTRLVAKAEAAFGVIEAAHAGQGDWQAWGERLLDAAKPLFHSDRLCIGIGRRREQTFDAVSMASMVPQALEFWARRGADIPAPALDIFWRYPHYVGTVEGVLGGTQPHPALKEFHATVGARDVLGLVAIVDDVSLSFGAPQQERIELSAKDRQLLTQVTLHVEAGLRLRVHPGAELAILHPDGRVLHAEGSARRHDETRNRLSRHVTRVERGRTRRHRKNVESVNAWSALISGAWGLVEREERDGSRHYAVLEATRARHLRALSELETHVVELSARGLTGKTVAYALGVTASAVSKALANAALKLGIRNRTELVRLVARLLGTGPAAQSEARLTTAERDVLSLVHLGWTNASIAAARGRSERTVANQVASLLRKLQVPSRRALAASSPR